MKDGEMKIKLSVKDIEEIKNLLDVLEKNIHNLPEEVVEVLNDMLGEGL